RTPRGSSPRARGSVWHSLGRDRRCPRDGCRASSAPARDTWPRTCPRRPARGAADGLFVPLAWRRGSCGFEDAVQLLGWRAVLPRKRHVVVLEQAVVDRKSVV